MLDRVAPMEILPEESNESLEYVGVERIPLIDELTSLLCENAHLSIDNISHNFLGGEPISGKDDPEVVNFIKKLIVDYLSEVVTLHEGVSVVYESMKMARFLWKDTFHYSPTIIDHDVIEAAQIGLNKNTDQLIKTKDVGKFRSILFWITQYPIYYNSKPRELTVAEQKEVAPMIETLVLMGEYEEVSEFFDLFHIYDMDGVYDWENESREGAKINKQREQTKEKMFKNREKICVALAQIDELAQTVDEQKIKAKLREMEAGALYGLPEQIRTRISMLAKRYLETRKRAERLFTDIKLRHVLTSTREDLGKAYFQEITGVKSTGKIDIYQKETMVVLEFHDENDYAEFIKRKFKIDEAEQPSGGRQCSADSFAFEDGGKGISVILIKKHKPQIKRNKVIAHERHHAIDEMLDLEGLEANNEQERALHLTRQELQDKVGTQQTFVEAVEKLKTDWNPLHYANLRWAKREIMAYLSDGTEPYRIPDILLSPTYRDMLSALGDFKIRRKFIYEIKLICASLDTILYQDYRPNAGKILAYHLKDIPFSRLLSYLDNLEQYRKKWDRRI